MNTEEHRELLMEEIMEGYTELAKGIEFTQMVFGEERTKDEIPETDTDNFFSCVKMSCKLLGKIEHYQRLYGDNEEFRQMYNEIESANDSIRQYMIKLTTIARILNESRLMQHD